MKNIYLAVIALIVILGAGLYYQFEVTKGDAELKARQIEISLMETPAVQPTAAPIADKPAADTTEVMEEDIDCLICHDVTKTKAFHVPQTILKIDARDGKRRKTCVDCHGPLGPPWSADRQMTPLSLMFFDETIGLNGVLQVDNSVPHSIHKGKLDSGAIRCQTCHGEDIEMVMPAPDAQAGQILVCQNCKFHPEGGNYITIHVQIAGKKCTICHTGGVINVHKAKTDRLGQV